MLTTATTPTSYIAHDVAADYLHSLQARLDDRASSIDSGFNALDAALPDWLSGGRLIVAASRPGVDRLGFAQALAENIARQGRMVLCFALGEARYEFAARAIARRADVSVAALRAGTDAMDKAQSRRVFEAINDFSHLPILFDDERNNLTSLVAKARHLHDRATRDPRLALDCIVVDSMQLLPESGDPDPERYPAARRLRMLARDTGVPVVALSALNSQETADVTKAPTLSDLPMGEHIEEYANLVLLLHRDEQDGGQRAGEPGHRGEESVQQ